MTVRGACRCGNISLAWRTIDYSLVPRACTCDYCRARQVAWVSKSNTALNLRVGNECLHRVLEQGSGQARFNECAHCGDTVWVSATIDGEEYGAVNLRCLEKAARFPAARPVGLTGLTAPQKLDRWRSNWCSPVVVEVLAASGD